MRMKENLGVYWAYYEKKRRFCKKAIPHAGYKALLDINSTDIKDYFVVTNNIDGLFIKAGKNMKLFIYFWRLWSK